jgi:flagellar biosynthesis protein FlhF
MHLKRYRSNSVREALAQARADLGPNALVLSTRLVGVRGWRGWLGGRLVEITAAANRDMSESRPMAQPTPRETAPAAPPTITPPDPLIAPMVARLCAAGLDRALAADAAAAVPRTRRRQASLALLRRAVADTLDPLTAGHAAFAAAEVFIGPPGVGKTTTIAKVAAQARARDGVRLGLVAADGFRVGAVEQLRLYADIIGAPFMVARTAAELDAVLDRVTGDPVLVDTAGRSIREPDWQEALALLGQRTGIRTHLVLSAAMQAPEAARLLDAYHGARPACVALTRVDESASIGPLVGLLRERRLPVSFLGTGQRVPEDLVRATGPVLAAHLLGEAPGDAGDRS